MELKIGDETYPLNTNALRNDEADAVERALGYSIAEFEQRLKAGWSSALTAYIWIMRRRNDPKLRLSDVKFTLSDVDTEFTDDEVRSILKAQDDDDDGTAEENRARVLASIPEGQRARIEAEADADPLASPASEQPEPSNEPSI